MKLKEWPRFVSFWNVLRILCVTYLVCYGAEGYWIRGYLSLDKTYVYDYEEGWTWNLSMRRRQVEEALNTMTLLLYSKGKDSRKKKDKIKILKSHGSLNAKEILREEVQHYTRVWSCSIKGSVGEQRKFRVLWEISGDWVKDLREKCLRRTERKCEWSGVIY